jgi:hypothetical protein
MPVADAGGVRRANNWTTRKLFERGGRCCTIVGFPQPVADAPEAGGGIDIDGLKRTRTVTPESVEPFVGLGFRRCRIVFPASATVLRNPARKIVPCRVTCAVASSRCRLAHRSGAPMQAAYCVLHQTRFSAACPSV